MQDFVRRIPSLARHAIRDARGVAAVEMGLTAPFLVFGLVMMLDAGIAVGERMDLDRNVRSGVQAAISNVTDPAAIRGFVLASAGQESAGMTVAVTKKCSCGETAASCASLCPGKLPPSVFIDISASRLHGGIILPDFQLESESRVQLR